MVKDTKGRHQDTTKRQMISKLKPSCGKMRYVIFIFTDEQNKDLLMVIEIWKIFITVPRVVFTKTPFSSQTLTKSKNHANFGCLTNGNDRHHRICSK